MITYTTDDKGYRTPFAYKSPLSPMEQFLLHLELSVNAIPRKYYLAILSLIDQGPIPIKLGPGPSDARCVVSGIVVIDKRAASDNVDSAYVWCDECSTWHRHKISIDLNVVYGDKINDIVYVKSHCIPECNEMRQLSTLNLQCKRNASDSDAVSESRHPKSYVETGYAVLHSIYCEITDLGVTWATINHDYIKYLPNLCRNLIKTHVDQF